MDWTVIEQKLESLRRCLRRVEEKYPPDVDTLAKDVDAQDILTLNLTRAVQLCVDIGAHLVTATQLSPPDTMGQTFDILIGVRAWLMTLGGTATIRLESGDCLCES
jgi:uncharacterized protein YutE (UPF0331/DUF86 family)